MKLPESGHPRRSIESVNCNELLLYILYQLKFGTPNFSMLESKKRSTKRPQHLMFSAQIKSPMQFIKTSSIKFSQKLNTRCENLAGV